MAAAAGPLGDKPAEHLCGGPANEPYALTDAEAQEFVTTMFTGMYADYGRSLRFFDRLTKTTGYCFERTQDRTGAPIFRDAAVRRTEMAAVPPMHSVTREHWVASDLPVAAIAPGGRRASWTGRSLGPHDLVAGR